MAVAAACRIWRWLTSENQTAAYKQPRPAASHSPNSTNFSSGQFCTDSRCALCQVGEVLQARSGYGVSALAASASTLCNQSPRARAAFSK